MIITVPNNNELERRYILDIVFKEFLGIDYQIQFSDIDSWILKFDRKEIEFKDSFFNDFKNDKEYLKKENIPQDANFGTNIFVVEKDIPIIFGNDFVKVEPQKIICGIDIFASSFFMLTRWEEHVNKKRDHLNRFSAHDSLAYKNNFLHRPVVNEYVEMLWNMFCSLGFSKKRKNRNFSFVTTHDVDFLLLKQTPLKIILRTIVGDVLKRKDMKLALMFMWEYIKSLFSEEKDPYNSFDYLMDVSEENKIKSYFFFMGEGKTIYDNNYKLNSSFLCSLLEKIKKREHFIGIHPTFDAYNDNNQFSKELNELGKHLETKITFGREHYLRFEVPTTWQIWNDNGMQWDSTLGYHDKEGFRCGVCYEYSVFNVLTRQRLDLKEKPLIVMEGTFAQYQKDISIEKVEESINGLLNKVKKYEGDFVFLWHNSSFNNREWYAYQKLYEKTLSQA